MMEYTEQINEYIQNKYPIQEQDSALEYSRNAMIHSKQIGLTHGLEIAVGFAEWIEKYFFKDGDYWIFQQATNRETKQTIQQLLNQYLDTLKTKYDERKDSEYSKQ